LRDEGLIGVGDAEILLSAAYLYQALSQIMRLCQEGRFDPEKAPAGLKAMLSRAAALPDFSRVAPTLREVQEAVTGCFDRLIEKG
jgi:glutamate-ammonia-ligase adenylyltransferase